MPDWLARLFHRGRKSQLDRIESTLAQIGESMSSQEQALDAAIDKVTTAFETLSDAISRVLAILSNLPDTPELADETAKLEAFAVDVQKAADDLNAASAPE